MRSSEPPRMRGFPSAPESSFSGPEPPLSSGGFPCFPLMLEEAAFSSDCLVGLV